jgi:hypothetical protein
VSGATDGPLAGSIPFKTKIWERAAPEENDDDDIETCHPKREERRQKIIPL